MPNSNVTITVTFKETTPVTNGTVTISAATHGTVTATVDGNPIKSGDEVKAGKTVAVKATPDEGYELDKVTVTDATYNETAGTFTMPEGNVTISATFKETEAKEYKFELDTTEFVGEVTSSVDSGKTVKDGDKVTLSFKCTTPEGWSWDNTTTIDVNGKSEKLTTDAAKEITITADTKVTLVGGYKETGSTEPGNPDDTEKTAKLTFASSGDIDLTVTVDGVEKETGAEVNIGSTVVITFTTAEGFAFDGTLKVNNIQQSLKTSEVDGKNVYTYEFDIEEDTTIEVTGTWLNESEIVKISVDKSQISNNGISISVPTIAQPNSTVTLTISGETEGYTFTVTANDGSDVTVTDNGDGTYTMTAGAAGTTLAITVTATYKGAVTIANVTGGTATATASKTGAITSGTTAVEAGETVTVTLIPNANYKSNGLKVTKTGATTTVTATKGSDENTYTFTMPQHPVTITPEFTDNSTPGATKEVTITIENEMTTPAYITAKLSETKVTLPETGNETVTLTLKNATTSGESLSVKLSVDAGTIDKKVVTVATTDETITLTIPSNCNATEIKITIENDSSNVGENTTN